MNSLTKWREDHHSQKYIRNLCSCEKNAWKTSGIAGILTSFLHPAVQIYGMHTFIQFQWTDCHDFYGKQTNKQHQNKFKTVNLWFILAQLCIFDLYIHTLFTGSHALPHLYEYHEVIPILRSLITDNPPCPGKVWPLRPLLFSNSGVRSFTSQKNQISYSLCLYPSRLESLTVYLKTLSVGPAEVWTCDLPPCRLALAQLS